MKLFEWLLQLFLDVDIWEHNTRARREDPEIAQWRAAQRRAGLAFISLAKMVGLALLWALFGASAGQPPYQGIAMLAHGVDLAMMWGVAGFMIAAVVFMYMAWHFEPDRS